MLFEFFFQNSESSSQWDMGTIILKQGDSWGKTLFTIRDWLRCMQVQFMLKHKPQVLWFSQTLINANFSQLKQWEGVHLKLRVFNIATNRDWASKVRTYWFERCTCPSKSTCFLYNCYCLVQIHVLSLINVN